MGWAPARRACCASAGTGFLLAARVAPAASWRSGPPHPRNALYGVGAADPGHHLLAAGLLAAVAAAANLAGHPSQRAVTPSPRSDRTSRIADADFRLQNGGRRQSSIVRRT